jgi:NAD(P)-dependent dehydrogenase (short-subunit alcohol dehydrogenase family)
MIMTGMLESKVAIVTGAASGIGAGTALRMAEEGARVVVADINMPGAESVVDAIRSAGGDAVAFQIDISDEAKVAAMMQFAVDTYGKLSVLNNNAGPVALLAAHDHELVNLDGDVWDKAFSIQLKGTMLCCKHAIPHLLRNGGGSIINISSTAGKLGGHYLITHQSSKAGVLALTRAVATRHGKDGIRCNAILPGFIDTPAFIGMPEGTRRTIMRHTMSPRGGVPDDIAFLTIFLGSDRSCYINGAEIPVDGGYSCHEPATADFMEMAQGKQ